MVIKHPHPLTYPLRSSKREMAFTFANLAEFTPTIAPALVKQFKRRYIGFYMSLTFKSAHCVEASRNSVGLVGILFLTFQIDTAAGFGLTEMFVTQIKMFDDMCMASPYTGHNEDQIAPLIHRIHTSITDNFMLAYDADTRQRHTNQFAETIHEELCAAALHPDRVGRLIDAHGIEALDSM